MVNHERNDNKLDGIVQTKNLTKTYGKNKTKVVKQFNISIERGHIYGLIGPNGAGKTTIMKMLAGYAVYTLSSWNGR